MHADASRFSLSELEKYEDGRRDHAELITMSHSLSLIPDFFPVVNMCEKLLSPWGIFGVVDFFLANVGDVVGRNYTAGLHNRHTPWWKRALLLAAAEHDRTGADANRRNYLEYKFGNIVSINTWEFHRRFIPYYAWIGCKRKPNFASFNSVLAETMSKEKLEPSRQIGKHLLHERIRQNMMLELPLPSYTYQNHLWRLPYDEALEAPNSTQLNQTNNRDSQIWYRTRDVSGRPSIPSSSRILALGTDSDTVLSYSKAEPRQLIVIDSTAQNHLLELKLAAHCSLNRTELQELFTTHDKGRFRQLLMEKASPFLSSRTLSWWLLEARRAPRRSINSIVR